MDINVAVIICVYGGDKYDDFKEAVLSIKNGQEGYSSDKIRIYLHVDGEVNSVLKSFIDDSNLFYKVIYSDIGIGLAAGLNKLIANIEDEKYLFRMDADDISLPNRIKKQVEFMENNSHIDIFGGGIKEFLGEQDNIVASRTYPEYSKSIKAYLSKGSPFAHVSVCFRRSSMLKVGLYPSEYGANEDIALWFQSLKNDCICYNLQEPLVLVRMDGAYSRRTLKKALGEFKIYLKICMWKKKLPIYPVFRLLFRLLPVFVIKKIYNSDVRGKVLNR